MMKYSKIGQAWGFDLLIAVSIFFIGMVIFFLYSINYPKEGQQEIEMLQYESDYIGEILLSEGYPSDWNIENLGKIGIVNNGKINETKLERFYSLANNNLNPSGYEQVKSLFNTRYNFFINFSRPIIISGSEILEGGIGKNFVGEDSENLLKTTRITTYQNSPVTMNLYLWN